ncbi:MAG: hypothetical protein RL115_2056 [Bacteroidota bacterium]|jgi:hypothetical protein
MQQNTNKYLKIAVALLLITNIALVVFTLWGKAEKTKRYSRPDITEMLAKELGFSEDQKATHRKMSEEHKKVIKPLMEAILAAKINYYTSIKETNVSDSVINEWGDKIAALQINLDKALFTHFKKVRSFLQPAQQLKYDSLVIKMMNRGKRDSAFKKYD